MGKTSKPLVIVVAPEIAGWEEWQELREKGHKVHIDDVDEVDLFFGPRMWHMTEQHRRYLDVALKNARARKNKGEKP